MKLNRTYVAVAAALASASGLTVAPAASAQEGLEEIVVTATRRAQNLQNVPISIVAITGDNLEQRGIDNLEEVSQGVPNVLVTGGTGTGLTNFRMRGIPNVGTYIDNVWQVGTAGFLTQEFVDVDRVEVLRGPQGTMFGRDSTGGAIRVWTKRPSNDFGGNVTATTGSYDRRDVRASLDLPLSETLLTKWTGAQMNRDGYIRSQTTGVYGGAIDQSVMRGDIVWMPTDRLDFRFNVSRNDSTFTEPRVEDAMFRTFDDPHPNWARAIIGLPEMYTYVGTDMNGNPVEPFLVPENQVSGYPGGRVGKWENRSNTVLPNRIRTDQISLETNWQISDNLKLQFLTAKTDQDANQVNEFDNAQYDLVTDINRTVLDVFSQEIQLTGGRERVDWVAGVYYWDQTQKARNARWQVNEFRKGLMDPANVFNHPVCNPAGALLEPTPATNDDPNNMRFAPGTSGIVSNGAQAGQLVNLGGAAGSGAGAWQTCQQIYYSGLTGAYDQMSRSGQDGWAAFGEATIHLTDTLDLTLGVRQHDQSGYTVNLVPIPGVTAPKPEDPTQYIVGNALIGADNAGTYSPFNFDKLTTRMVLQKQFRPNMMGYFSYSEGFNSGGVSAAVINNVRTLFPFAPSTLENAEIGMRMDLADGKVRFNWTVFDTTWADLQAFGVAYDPVTGAQLSSLLTTNVGEAEAKGVELELTLLPTDNILVNVGLGLLDTAYTKINPGTRAGHLPLDAGTEFTQAPDKSYTLGFQHTATFRSGATWVSRLDYNYQGQFWRSDPFLRVTGYEAIPDGYDESGDWGILNLRFTYEPADANWSASFFGTNLTNEYMINSGIFHGVWGFDFATVSRPREAGASLTFRF